MSPIIWIILIIAILALIFAFVGRGRWYGRRGPY
jgi:uncharacterized membrane protein